MAVAADLVPVTVVTGGAEASLLVHRMRLGLADDPIGVLSGNAGAAADDIHEWLRLQPVEGSRSSGCACCRVRLDLVEGLRLLVDRRVRPERVIVLLDALDDLSTALQTLLSDPDLQRLVELDGVIQTVDAVALSTRVRLGLPFGAQPELERLAIADRVLVVRGDELVDEALHSVMVGLRTVAGFGLTAVPSIWPVAVKELVGLNAWHGAPAVQPRIVSAPVVVEHGCERPDTVYCEVDGELDPDAVEEWLDEIVAVNASRILRLQGAVRVAGQEFRVCLRGVRSFATSHSELMHPVDQRSTRSIVAVAGYGLDAAAIRSGFDATALR